MHPYAAYHKSCVSIHTLFFINEVTILKSYFEPCMIKHDSLENNKLQIVIPSL